MSARWLSGQVHHLRLPNWPNDILIECLYESLESDRHEAVSLAQSRGFQRNGLHQANGEPNVHHSEGLREGCRWAHAIFDFDRPRGSPISQNELCEGEFRGCSSGSGESDCFQFRKNETVSAVTNKIRRFNLEDRAREFAPGPAPTTDGTPSLEDLRSLRDCQRTRATKRKPKGFF